MIEAARATSRMGRMRRELLLGTNAGQSGT